MATRVAFAVSYILAGIMLLGVLAIGILAWTGVVVLTEYVGFAIVVLLLAVLVGFLSR